ADQVLEGGHERVAGAGAGETLDALGAEGVIALPLLGVREHAVGLVQLLDALFGLGVVGVRIRMDLAGLPAVGPLDLLRARVPRDAEQLVVVGQASPLLLLPDPTLVRQRSGETPGPDCPRHRSTSSSTSPR